MSSTSPITAVGSSAAGTDKAPAPVENPGMMLDRDAFLKLLVAQLKFQDPSKPADTSQMLSQSAQLTMVESMNELKASYQLSAASEQLSLAGSIVGREITFLDVDGNSVTARVDTAQVAGEEMILIAGGYNVPFDAVSSVHAPQPAANEPV